MYAGVNEQLALLSDSVKLLERRFDKYDAEMERVYASLDVCLECDYAQKADSVMDVKLDKISALLEQLPQQIRGSGGDNGRTTNSLNNTLKINLLTTVIFGLVVTVIGGLLVSWGMKIT